MKNNLLKLLVSVLAVCVLFTGTVTCSVAEEVSPKDTLQPLMDLVSAAALYADIAESIPGAQGTLNAGFVQAFLLAGQHESSELGIAADYLKDTDAQQSLLSSVFAAQLPELTALEPFEDDLDFIGFYPVMQETLEDGSLRFTGEIYTANKPIRNMASAEFAGIQWIERALFTFAADASAMNGYRLTAFALGTDLTYEEAFRAYEEEIAVEYESALGFMVQYPATFADEILIETENGVTAQGDNGQVQFSATRNANSDKATLASYIEAKSAAIAGSTYAINDEMQYATLQYKDENGHYVFEVISVTEEHIYTAELRCAEELLKDYSMFFSYLENSFVIDELCQG